MNNQDVYSVDCLAHDPGLRDDLDCCLKALKGRVISKRLIKRCPYLVCTCKKKHTALDDVFQQDVSIPGIVQKLGEILQNVDLVSPESDDKHCQPDTSVPEDNHENYEKTIVSSGAEEQSANRTKNQSMDVSNVLQKLNNNPLLLELLTKKTAKTDLTSSQGRFLTIIHSCLTKNTTILEPREMHKEKVNELRFLSAGTYYTNRRKSNKRFRAKYSFEESVVIDEKNISIAMFVGRDGKNIKGINRDKDCRLGVNLLGQKIQVKIRATSEEDRDVLRGRVHQVGIYLCRQRRSWEWLQKKQRAERNLTKQTNSALATRQTEPTWEIDTERKESARDEFSKKVSYHKSKPRQVTSKTTVLDDGARCINCLTPYTKQLLSQRCRYHAGYIRLTGRWSCCDRVSRGKKVTVTTDNSVDGQRLGHTHNGCKFGQHNWRPTKMNNNFVRRTNKYDRRR